MRLLEITIAGYIIGLAIFYLCASFNTFAWDIVYFGWAKLLDAGVMFWAVLYFSGGHEIKKLVRWLFVFSIIRFAQDIQSFFTGIGVNNERLVAILFLCLICTTAYLCLKPDGRPAKWLNRKVFKSD